MADGTETAANQEQKDKEKTRQKKIDKMPPSMQKLIRDMKEDAKILDAQNKAEKEEKIAKALSQVKTTRSA